VNDEVGNEEGGGLYSYVCFELHSVDIVADSAQAERQGKGISRQLIPCFRGVGSGAELTFAAI
jgi:hypothetical protein